MNRQGGNWADEPLFIDEDTEYNFGDVIDEYDVSAAETNALFESELPHDYTMQKSSRVCSNGSTPNPSATKLRSIVIPQFQLKKSHGRYQMNPERRNEYYITTSSMPNVPLIVPFYAYAIISPSKEPLIYKIVQRQTFSELSSGIMVMYELTNSFESSVLTSMYGYPKYLDIKIMNEVAHPGQTQILRAIQNDIYLQTNWYNPYGEIFYEHQHPNIRTVYFAMAHADGKLSEVQHIREQDAIKIVYDVCTALHYFQEKYGLIYNNVSTDNIHYRCIGFNEYKITFVNFEDFRPMNDTSAPSNSISPHSFPSPMVANGISYSSAFVALEQNAVWNLLLIMLSLCVTDTKVLRYFDRPYIADLFSQYERTPSPNFNDFTKWLVQRLQAKSKKALDRLNKTDLASFCHIMIEMKTFHDVKSFLKHVWNIFNVGAKPIGSRMMGVDEWFHS
jgi:hypothetical protein